MRTGESPNVSLLTSASSVSNTALSILSGAKVFNAACTLIDGYLTRRTLRQGFATLDATLKNGFTNLTTAIETGFEKLDARFSWGFSELMWRADQQTKVMEETNRILTEWLDVRAKELRKKVSNATILDGSIKPFLFFLSLWRRRKLTI